MNGLRVPVAIVVVMIGIFFSLLGFSWQQQIAVVNALQRNDAAQEERLGRSDSNQIATDRRLTRIEQGLDAANAKLDRLAERVSPR